MWFSFFLSQELLFEFPIVNYYRIIIRITANYYFFNQLIVMDIARQTLVKV